MFEEHSPPRYLTRLPHPESSQETSTAASHVLGDEENTGHVPEDNSDGPAPAGDSPAPPTAPQHRPEKLQLLMSRQKAEYEAKIAR